MENNSVWGQLVSTQISTINLDFDYQKNFGKMTIPELKSRVKISGLHFMMKRIEDGNKPSVSITDYSTNGTWVNGKRIEKGKETVIQCFDEITLLDKTKYSEAVTFVYHDKMIINNINSQCDLLKKYKIGTFLGKGQYGVVREVIENETQIHYAIKIIEKQHSVSSKNKAKSEEENKKMEETILRECSTMEKVNHENAVRFKEMFNIKDYIFIIMELIEGVSLTSIIKNKELTEEQRLDLIKQLINLVNHLHSLNVVHRDLKPDNIMVVEGNKLKLVDFGFGKELDETNKTATLIGTPFYSPPELLTIIPTAYDGKKVDIWSAGVIIFELLVGYLPYRNKVKDMNQLKEVIEKEMYKSDECFMTLNKDIQNLIEGMMEKNADYRYSAEVCVELIEKMELKRTCPEDIEVPDAKRNIDE